jgi:hypothetical protein
VTVAVPEKETLLSPPAEHACARRAASRSEPVSPRSTALPLNVTQVGLVKVPCAEPLIVPRPISRPRPRSFALPEALVPLASPCPCPA